jgi:ATP-dependent DNA ligase
MAICEPNSRTRADLVQCAGRRLRIGGGFAESLLERKRVLQSVLVEAGTSTPRLLYSDHFEDGADLYARVSAMGFEGIVSKRANARYRSGRGEHWIKINQVSRREDHCGCQDRRTRSRTSTSFSQNYAPIISRWR